MKKREQCNNATNFHALRHLAAIRKNGRAAGPHTRLASFNLPLDLTFSRRPRYCATELLLEYLRACRLRIRQEQTLWLPTTPSSSRSHGPRCGSRVFAIHRTRSSSFSGNLTPAIGKRQKFPNIPIRRRTSEKREDDERREIDDPSRLDKIEPPTVAQESQELSIPIFLTRRRSDDDDDDDDDGGNQRASGNRGGGVMVSQSNKSCLMLFLIVTHIGACPDFGGR